jgi:dihydrofolate reductase
MANVTSDMSMSLDGFITGPNDDVERPLGEGGERLHQWIFELASWRERHGLAGGKTNRDAEVVDEAFRNVGVVVMGRRMFNHGEGPWGDNPPFHMPVFVVTHKPKKTLSKEGGTTFTFVTDGIESAPEAGQGRGRRQRRLGGRRREYRPAVPESGAARRDTDSPRAGAARRWPQTVRARREDGIGTDPGDRIARRNASPIPCRVT